MPAFSHKHSPKKYTQHQHLAILLLKRRFKASYRDVTAYLAEMPDIQAILGSKAPPHFSTIHKFMRRIDEAWLLSLFDVCTSHHVVIDSTGFSTYSSSWYERLASRIRKRRYAKLYIAADPARQLILNAMPGIGYSHDSPYLIPLAKELDFGVLIADKGFDSLRNIRWVLSRGAKPLIAIKRNVTHPLRMRLRRYNKHVYAHRAKAETIISVIKRKFGEHVSGRSWPALRKEVILLALAYNVHRESLFLNLLIWSKITSIYN